MEGKVIADYKLDTDYKSKGSDPAIKQVNQVEEEVNSNAEHARIVLSH